MKLKEKARFIQKILNEYFPEPAIPLSHSNPYTLLIAVLLSAQTTDRQVNIVTKELFRRAKTPQEMVQMSISEIHQIIKSCGLAPKKAKAIHALSIILIEKHGGKVPDSFEALEELPGVGHKTASVVMTSAFSKPAFPVDTHIFRSAKRWGLSKGKTREKVEADLKKLFPKNEWHRLHLQIIYFARAFCTAKNHNPEKCPICSKNI